MLPRAQLIPGVGAWPKVPQAELEDFQAGLPEAGKVVDWSFGNDSKFKHSLHMGMVVKFNSRRVYN